MARAQSAPRRLELGLPGARHCVASAASSARGSGQRLRRHLAAPFYPSSLPFCCCCCCFCCCCFCFRSSSSSKGGPSEYCAANFAALVHRRRRAGARKGAKVVRPLSSLAGHEAAAAIMVHNKMVARPSNWAQNPRARASATNCCSANIQSAARSARPQLKAPRQRASERASELCEPANRTAERRPDCSACQTGFGGRQFRSFR